MFKGGKKIKISKKTHLYRSQSKPYKNQLNHKGQYMENWQYWIIAGIVLFAIEVYTPGFVLASFGMACILSGLAAALGFSMGVQLSAFAAGSVLFFVTIRPFVKKFLYNKEKLATGTNALIGKTGKVTEKINNMDNVGRVQVGGESWKACSETEDQVDEGELVEVTGVSGVTLKVRKR